MKMLKWDILHRAPGAARHVTVATVEAATLGDAMGLAYAMLPSRTDAECERIAVYKARVPRA